MTTGMEYAPNTKIEINLHQKLTEAGNDDLFNVVVKYNGPILDPPRTTNRGHPIRNDANNDIRNNDIRTDYRFNKLGELIKRYDLEFDSISSGGLMSYAYFNTERPIQLRAEQVLDLDKNVEDIFRISEGPDSSIPYLIPRRTIEERLKASNREFFHNEDGSDFTPEQFAEGVPVFKFTLLDELVKE